MNYFTLSNYTTPSHIEHEEYIPLRVIFDSKIGNSSFIGFYFGNNNLLEFSIDENNGMIKKLQIVTCKNFECIKESFTLPSAKNCSGIFLTYPQHNNCDTFMLKVYSNCFHINISSADISKYYSMGQVIFGIDKESNISSIIITDVTASDISHTIYELQAD